MIFLFEEDFSEYEYYDYHTSPVNGDEVIDKNKASNSYAQGMLDGSEADYYKKEKNRYSKIVEMSPNEYYNACAEGFGNSVSNLKASRNHDPKYIRYLMSIITDHKKRFPIPYIDYSNGFSQEGLHRMYALGELFGWDKKQPVQIIDVFDKERAERETSMDEELMFYRKVERALESVDVLSVGVDEFEKDFKSSLKKYDPLKEYKDKFFNMLSLDKENDRFIIEFNGNHYYKSFEVLFDDFFGNSFDDIDIDDIDIDWSDIDMSNINDILKNIK